MELFPHIWFCTRHRPCPRGTHSLAGEMSITQRIREINGSPKVPTLTLTLWAAWFPHACPPLPGEGGWSLRVAAASGRNPVLVTLAPSLSRMPQCL